MDTNRNVHMKDLNTLQISVYDWIEDNVNSRKLRPMLMGHLEPVLSNCYGIFFLLLYLRDYHIMR